MLACAEPFLSQLDYFCLQIGQFDMDEYLIPMGSYTSLLPILDKLDNEGMKIISFGSWRAWPRRDLIA
jgi:hypothetical protein